MEITDEIYKDLSKRIDEGEFIRLYKKGIPSMPGNLDEQTRNFAKECEGTLSLYRAKMNALWGQLQSMRKIIDEKEATDRANLFVKNYDTKLEEQYNAYRTSTEESIAQLKQDLTEMKELTNESIRENKKLKAENDVLNETIIKQKSLLSLQEIKMKDLEKAANHPFTIGEEDFETNKLLKERDEEIERLRKQNSEKDKEIQSISTACIEACLDYYADTNRTKDEASDKIINTVKNTLVTIVKKGFAPYVDNHIVGSLLMLISDLEEKREKFKNQQKEIADAQSLQEKKYSQKIEQERTQAIKESAEALKQNGKGTTNINIETFQNQAGATYNDLSESCFTQDTLPHLPK